MKVRVAKFASSGRWSSNSCCRRACVKVRVVGRLSWWGCRLSFCTRRAKGPWKRVPLGLEAKAPCAKPLRVCLQCLPTVDMRFAQRMTHAVTSSSVPPGGHVLVEKPNPHKVNILN